MWFTITLREVNDIPAGTLVRIIKWNGKECTILNESTGEKVIMHQPAWWCDSVGFGKIFGG